MERKCKPAGLPRSVIIAPRRLDYPHTVVPFALGKDLRVDYNSVHPWGQAKAMISGDSCVRTKISRSVQNMKKLLALMFALALSVSMSSFAFAQAAGGDKPADKPADKKEEKKEKKAAKTKKAKKEKKDEMKKDEAPK
jgi:hypothetical protein